MLDGLKTKSIAKQDYALNKNIVKNQFKGLQRNSRFIKYQKQKSLNIICQYSTNKAVQEPLTNGQVDLKQHFQNGSISSPSEYEKAQERMKKFGITVFSAQQYVIDFIEEPMNHFCPNVKYVQAPLDSTSAKLAEGTQIINIFVNDIADKEAIKALASCGVKLIALRCAGFDRVDLEEASKHGIKVVRVPAYSPQSVAEHAVTLMVSLSRNIHLAYNRVAFNNFSLSGLVGNEIGRKTVGIYGTGAIGVLTAKILKYGFGCRVLGYNHRPPKQSAIDAGIEFVSEDQIFLESDILSLHVPLKKELNNMMNKKRFEQMKQGAMLINVSRGGLIDTEALIEALHSGKLRGAGLDVYEHEHELFFEDRSQYSYKEIGKHWDNKFAILRSYPNVIVTPHSAFLTDEALANIAKTTIDNIQDWVLGKKLENQVYFDNEEKSEICGPDKEVCEIP